MKNQLRVDHANRRIVMDRTFAKLSENVRSEEYALLQTVRRDYPEYIVARKQIKKNASKECYKGLTYEYMENYIALHEDAEKIRAEYDELRLLAECHSVRYPTIKKWFLTKYPEAKNFGVFTETQEEQSAQETKIEIITSDAKAA